MGGALTALRTLAIAHACEQHVLRMMWALDHGDVEGFAAGFDERGRWSRRGETLEGRDAILAATRRRKPAVRLHHVLTNVIVDVQDERQARLRCYMTGARAEVAPDVPPPVPAQERALWSYDDELLLTPEGWRVQHRRTVRIFENPVRDGPG